MGHNRKKEQKEKKRKSDIEHHAKGSYKKGNKNKKGSRYGDLRLVVVAIQSFTKEIERSHRRILPQRALDLDVLVGLVEVPAPALILVGVGEYGGALTQCCTESAGFLQRPDTGRGGIGS